MTPASVAATLDGTEYGKEASHGFFTGLKAEGIVAVFGASDDLMEFRGAIYDEVGCYNGGTAYLTKDGLLANDCENDDCPHFAKMKAKAVTIKAIWDDGGFSWRYETAIPHATFIVKEDGENYCEGIVFMLDDVVAGILDVEEDR